MRNLIANVAVVDVLAEMFNSSLVIWAHWLPHQPIVLPLSTQQSRKDKVGPALFLS